MKMFSLKKKVQQTNKHFQVFNIIILLSTFVLNKFREKIS